MTTIARLGPSVRLVVIQFLIKSDLVPAIVPPKREETAKPANSVQISGRQVLESTEGVYLLNMLDGICPINDEGPYELVDAWHIPHKKSCHLSVIRYVFCHEDHVKYDGLNRDFAAKRDQLIESLVSLINDNLWTIQGHLNPYFDNEGAPTENEVLMLGCASRNPTVEADGRQRMIFQGGRDKTTGQGIGPKIPIRDRAMKISVADNVVQLV